MSKKVEVGLDLAPYTIHIADTYEGMSDCIKGLGEYSKIAVITDTNVEKFQLQNFLDALGTEAETYAFKAGETNKNIYTAIDIYRFLKEKKIDRKAIIVALGGGVVGDMVGLVAATYNRGGARFVQVPTTTLAQADSSVGGKVGVDLDEAKNLVGAFYQPAFVWINVSTLKTLPEREFWSGFAETIKHGIILDREFFDFIRENMSKIQLKDPEVLQVIAEKNCRIKSSVVVQDEKDTLGKRAMLNFGHTFGHAIESASGYTLLHGECVAIGMVCAYKMAVELGIATQDDFMKVKETLEAAELPTSFKGIDTDEIYRLMFTDKKAEGGKLNFILPVGIGRVLMRTIEDEELIKRSLR